MPRRHHLREGPTRPSDNTSNNEDSPQELADSQSVRGVHDVVIEVLSVKLVFRYDRDEEIRMAAAVLREPDPSEFAIGIEKRRGTGRVFPTEIVASPYNLINFPPTRVSVMGTPIRRYVHRDGHDTLLIMTDGACSNNGRSNTKAGWAFVTGPGCVCSGRLESKGPFGDPGIQSNNRAELRAVIAAIRFREWQEDGFMNLVIATDSKHVMKGATQWARTWTNNGWKTRGGADVKNKDLWEMLLGEVERKRDQGLFVDLWYIPREFNAEADAAAKAAAEVNEVSEEWCDIFGAGF